MPTLLGSNAASAEETKQPPNVAASDINSLEEAALAAYLYTYPLVSVEVTRQQSTNLDGDSSGSAVGTAPMNELAHIPYLPDASFTSVVRPNVDTLYTSMFYDVSKEPMIINVPDMGDRYHLFQIMDMWTNVEGAPGTRTIDDTSGGYRFAIVGDRWRGTLPAGVHEYRVDTDTGWMLARTQVDGPEDVAAVNALQTQITAAPLSSYRTSGTSEPSPDSATAPSTPSPTEAPPTVSDVIHSLSPQEYWDLYYSSLSHDQPRDEDKEFLAEMAKFGWSPYTRLNLDRMPERTRAVWETAWPKAIGMLDTPIGGEPVNGWSIQRTGIGDYGTDYVTRAVVARNALAANLPEDAIYPVTDIDSHGERLHSDHNYVLHFPAGQIPPVNAFWSLTMYDAEGYLVDNSADRYAVRGETLTKNADGSLDIYIQSENPGADKESNWLPAPSAGDFNVMLRAYWPDEDVIDGTWNPPAIERTS